MRWGDLSDAPTDPMKLIGRIPTDTFNAVLKRPWHWLSATARSASVG
jgi:hypothetical protein